MNFGASSQNYFLVVNTQLPFTPPLSIPSVLRLKLVIFDMNHEILTFVGFFIDLRGYRANSGRIVLPSVFHDRLFQAFPERFLFDWS